MEIEWKNVGTITEGRDIAVPPRVEVSIAINSARIFSSATRWFMLSQKKKLSATNDLSLLARRMFSAAMLSAFLAPSHFFMTERMVVLDGEYGARERIEMTPYWELRVRFTEPKLMVAWVVI